MIYLPTINYVMADRTPANKDQGFFRDLLLAHEVAHQWWGNVVTSGSYHHEWLMEALANYSGLMYMESRLGPVAGPKATETALEAYRRNLFAKGPDGETAESEGPVVQGRRLEGSNNPAAATAVMYGKGSWVMHMLRRRLGDDRFLKALAEVRRRYEWKPIDTDDFRLLCAEFLPSGSTDPKLENFFDQWVYGTGVPTLKMTFSVKGRPGAYKLTGTVTQADVPDDFSIAVPIEVQTAAGKRIVQQVRTSSDPVSFTPVNVAAYSECEGAARPRPERVAAIDVPRGRPRRFSAANPAERSVGGRAEGPTVKSRFPMHSYLVCFNAACRARFDIREVLYNCPACGGLLEAAYERDAVDAAEWKRTWRERRMDNAPLNQSGVWRYREMFPFLDNLEHVVTLREGNTPLLDAPHAAAYGGLTHLTFKHQGFNPTGSFKDNGMTAGAAQARRLGMKRVACVSTGNTSASMAAYASAAGLEPLIFIPHGNISYGKLAQALEYGAKTFQVEANFDQILALVRTLAERLGIYLLNSINPFRIEGQKSIVIEMMDQRDWKVPDWIVLPGGNLGNVSAFGKGLREMLELGLIDRLPRLAVVQAAGASPFYKYLAAHGSEPFEAEKNPETLATAIRIGDPVSWPKAQFEIETSMGAVEQVTEQEIADAKAIIGQCGIGCEPASAATLAGIRKMTRDGIIDREADVVAVLTGNVLKDPDYIYRYHTGQLQAPDGSVVSSSFGNKPIVVPNDPDKLAELIG